MISGKALASELRLTWKNMAQAAGLHPEIAYRVAKLSERIAPLVDKAFLKTIKAGELLLECREKTAGFQQHLKEGGEKTYHLLTDLERTFEDLAKRTYEFRIKAG
jgi:hypothetical protein